jgi:hypothetical protein
MNPSHSDQNFPCPECGTLLSAGADCCWKCRHDFHHPGATAGASAKPASNAADNAGSPPSYYSIPTLQREPHRSQSPHQKTGIFLFKIFFFGLGIIIATFGAAIVVAIGVGMTIFAICSGGISGGEDKNIGFIFAFVGVVAIGVFIIIIRAFWRSMHKNTLPHSYDKRYPGQ